MIRELVYVVRAAFDDPEVARAFGSWLSEEHVGQVRDAGAEAAEVVSVDGGLEVEARYRFRSREHFAAYERDHAPRLRAAGLEVCARLGVAPDRGVRFTRWTGALLHRQG